MGFHSLMSTHSHLLWKGLLISLIHRWGNEGLEMVNNQPKAAMTSDRAGIPKANLFLEHMNLLQRGFSLFIHLTNVNPESTTDTNSASQSLHSTHWVEGDKHSTQWVTFMIWSTALSASDKIKKGREEQGCHFRLGEENSFLEKGMIKDLKEARKIMPKKFKEILQDRVAGSEAPRH